MRKLTMGLAVLAVLGGAVACSSKKSDSQTPEGKPYVAAIADKFQHNGTRGLVLNAPDSECVAGRWVNAITLATLKAKKVQPTALKSGQDTPFRYPTLKLDQDQATKMYAAFGDCGVDIRAVFLKSENKNFGPKFAACLDKNLATPVLEEVIESAFRFTTPAKPLQAQLDAIDKKCPTTR